MPRPPAAQPERRRHPWWIPLAARVLSGLLTLLVATARVRIGPGAERFERLLASGEPAILAFWHNRLAVCGVLISRLLIRRGHPVTMLASQSRDGELAARLCLVRGYRVVRGSSSRGGLSGFRQLRRAIAHDRSSVMAAPDGPRGPAREVQPGTVMLARLTGAPILPVAYAASRCWRLGSWDRLVVPHPFSRVVFAVGEPLEVAADASGDGLAASAAELGRRLDELVSRAEAMV